jgi:hypothetical protein
MNSKRTLLSACVVFGGLSKVKNTFGYALIWSFDFRRLAKNKSFACKPFLAIFDTKTLVFRRTAVIGHFSVIKT